MKTLCVLPPPGPCFCACPSKFASVARGYLLSNLRILRTFLQVTGVYLTCLSSYSCCFCHLFAGAGDRFCFGFNVLGSNRCLCALLHSVCYGATVHTGHRCEYCAHGDGWGGGSCDVSSSLGSLRLRSWR